MNFKTILYTFMLMLTPALLHGMAQPPQPVQSIANDAKARVTEAIQKNDFAAAQKVINELQITHQSVRAPGPASVLADMVKQLQVILQQAMANYQQLNQPIAPAPQPALVLPAPKFNPQAGMLPKPQPAPSTPAPMAYPQAGILPTPQPMPGVIPAPKFNPQAGMLPKPQAAPSAPAPVVYPQAGRLPAYQPVPVSYSQQPAQSPTAQLMPGVVPGRLPILQPASPNTPATPQIMPGQQLQGQPTPVGYPQAGRLPTPAAPVVNPPQQAPSLRGQPVVPAHVLATMAKNKPALYPAMAYLGQYMQSPAPSAPANIAAGQLQVPAANEIPTSIENLSEMEAKTAIIKALLHGIEQGIRAGNTFNAIAAKNCWLQHVMQEWGAGAAYQKYVEDTIIKGVKSRYGSLDTSNQNTVNAFIRASASDPLFAAAYIFTLDKAAFPTVANTIKSYQVFNPLQNQIDQFIKDQEYEKAISYAYLFKDLSSIYRENRSPQQNTAGNPFLLDTLTMAPDTFKNIDEQLKGLLRVNDNTKIREMINNLYAEKKYITASYVWMISSAYNVVYSQIPAATSANQPAASEITDSAPFNIAFDQWYSSCNAALQNSAVKPLSFDAFKQAMNIFINKTKARFANANKWFNTDNLNTNIPEGNIPYVERVHIPKGSIVGFHADIHGNVQALNSYLRALADKGYLDKQNQFKIADPNFYLIFLGDYVDRGIFGVEVLYTLMRLKLTNPDRVFLARGNHEDADFQNVLPNGLLTREVATKFGVQIENELAKLLPSLYNCLPVALYTQVGNAAKKEYILCCHGGWDVGYDPVPFLTANKTYHAFDTLHYKDILDQLPGDIRTTLQSFANRYPRGAGKYTQNPKITDITSLDFLWNDFYYEDETTVAEFMDGRGLQMGQPLIQALRSLTAHNGINIQAIFRAHQHSGLSRAPMWMRAMVDNKVTKLWPLARSADPALWLGMVITFLVSPNEGYPNTFDSWGELHVGDDFVSSSMETFQNNKNVGIKTEVPTPSPSSRSLFPMSFGSSEQL